jgi:sugar lactone lactonase YvrE
VFPSNEVTTTMKKMRTTQLSLCLVVLTAASCGFPRLSELVDGGGGAEDGAPPPFGLELLAGDIGGPGNADGTGATARFYEPTGVAVDSAGNVYVGDQKNHTIRKVTAAGVVMTLAGTAGMAGSADGTGTAARFLAPSGVAVDSAGNVYVADQSNHTIRKVTAAGVVTTLAGTAGMLGSADGTGAAARFRGPIDVAVDSAGNVYVADVGNEIIRKVTAAGVVTTLAGTAGMLGSADGTGAAARFDGPDGVAVDSAGNVYVADRGNSTIRKVTAAGVVTTLADDTGAAASFTLPFDVAVDSAGNIYVSDYKTIRKVTSAGVVTTLAGAAGMVGFGSLAGVAVDSAGNVYVADFGNNIICKVTAAGVMTTLAGAAGAFGSTDGTGAAARFSGPFGVAIDSTGNVYVADQGNSTIRKVTTAGVVTTLAGTAGTVGSADGTGSAARFGGPISVAVDSTGNVYVADRGNSTIRKVTTAGVVTTLAGTAGAFGSADGTGADARFSGPIDVAVDSAGNVYVADSNNFTIRKVTPAGVVTTLAGTAGMTGSADGTGADARFSSPTGVAVDSAGNVYVADYFSHTIRKVTAAGVVTTLAGTAGAVGSADGTGVAARFSGPIGVAVDSAGNVYVADQNNSTIRKVTPTGITTTVAGTAGMAGILLGATPRFALPRSLAIVGDSIVVSDTNAILLLRHGAQ